MLLYFFKLQLHAANCTTSRLKHTTARRHSNMGISNTMPSYFGPIDDHNKSSTLYIWLYKSPTREIFNTHIHVFMQSNISFGVLNCNHHTRVRLVKEYSTHIEKCFCAEFRVIFATEIFAKIKKKTGKNNTKTSSSDVGACSDLSM